jgi:hypothetical protein
MDLIPFNLKSLIYLQIAMYSEMYLIFIKNFMFMIKITSMNQIMIIILISLIKISIILIIIII